MNKFNNFHLKSKLPLKLQYILRNNLKFPNYPVGSDVDGNIYYDNGLMRKVVKANGEFLIPITVMKEYSDWLNFKLVVFPIVNKKEPCPNSSITDPKLIRKFYKIYGNKLNKSKIIYTPDTELVILFSNKLIRYY